MIRAGWVMVPLIPTERMLNEFSGVWWPHVDREELRRWAKDKRLLEEQAYAAMLAVAPTPPEGGTDEVQLLREQIKRLEKRLGQSQAETKKAYKKLEYVWGKVRTLQGLDKPCESLSSPETTTRQHNVPGHMA